MGKKSYFEAYLLAITPIGLFGGLHFYLNRPYIGLLYMCTVGVFGLGYLVDLFRAPILVKEANMKKLHKKDPTQPLPPQISIVDAYLTWFPFGIFGLHHLYMKRHTWAVIYLATFGLFLVGWLVDAIWMVSMVNEANFKLTDPGAPSSTTTCAPPDLNPLTLRLRHKLLSLVPILEIARRKEKRERKKRKLAMADDTTVVQDDTLSGQEKPSTDQVEVIGPNGLDLPNKAETTTDQPVATASSKVRPRGPEARAAVALAFSILGLFGAHHYYLKRTGWGVLYTVTLGLVGIGKHLIWNWTLIYILTVVQPTFTLTSESGVVTFPR
ncbi:hypothetical protein PoB_004731800 [Plakobranchus ocellatus]|uniref:TM2 domain-containing protein n=1 Tax=Plakobranchus ocellatus TaxID=259542 RepID=A0AAV4BMM1_9GAST|nr:hypothetical protein PoB_004731800 [Plakobranchus ocellatus]